MNWVGLWTLLTKEVRRFLKVWTQTLVAPIGTTLIFLAVFTLALSGTTQRAAGVPFAEFLAPGLMMMAMMQNAFGNNSASIMIAKIDGTIVDVLMPPLGAGELTFCYATGGVIRGLLVGLCVGAGMRLFVPLHLFQPAVIALYAVLGTLMFSLLGIVGSIWAEKFDHMASITNFVITPITFLSGTFYTADRLVGFWSTLAHFNPVFYLVDGFRYGFIGHADQPVSTGIAILAIVDATLYALVHRIFATGYKLRA